MYTLGTAGHVDHGKSTLVQALTGINPDRWAEEQRREMTIDLGFAWLTLPSGREISLVDVPGHERFIKNMLAGVGGLDAVLLVIAADEGVQPQTIEHLHILDLLGIQHGLIVLTKADLVDAAWLQLVHEEVREHVAATTLAAAPLVEVSARTGAGLDQLTHALDGLLDSLPPRSVASGTPRLPIDRVFSISGFGTVVTGTLLDGALQLGDEVEIQPAGLRGRIRGLQTHQQQRETVQPGTRVAVNLSGVERQAVQRGAVLCQPAALQPTSLIDVQLRLVATAPTLAHNTPLDLAVGTSVVAAHVALLDQDTLGPGQTGWVQLRLAQPIAVARGDRCIVRRPSPAQTIGGGPIIDVHPPRHRRFRSAVIAHLELLAHGSPTDLLLQALAATSPLEWHALVARAGLDAESSVRARTALCNSGDLLIVQPEQTSIAADTLVTSRERWAALRTSIGEYVDQYHTRWPLRAGMSREELRARLDLSQRVFNAVLARAVHEGWLSVTKRLVLRPSWQPMPTPPQQAAAAAVLSQWRANPTTPPGRAVLETLDPEVQSWLFESGQLVRVSADIALLPETLAAMLAWVQQRLASAEPLTLASFRDAWSTTRKYAQALLEYTDEQHITRRVGDERIAY